MNIRSIGAAMLLIASLAAPTLAGAQARFQFDTTPGHLSKQVVPTRYVLHLDLDPARDTFGATARIEVRVREAVPAIEVHAHGLTATRARLLAGGVTRALDVQPLPESQSWRLVPADGAPIAAGTHVLEFDYAGAVHVAGEGLYRGALPGGRTAAAHAGHAAPSDLCAHAVPVVRRAIVSCRLRDHGARAEGRGGRVQHAAGGSPEPTASSSSIASRPRLPCRATWSAWRWAASTCCTARAAGVPLRVLTRRGQARASRATRCRSPSRCCPTTAATSACPTRCPSSTSSRCPACAGARWKTGA